MPKESFFFVASDVVPILYNKPCILEINIFGRDGIMQIWIISSKDIDTQCLCKIYCRELGQDLMQFGALEKSAMSYKLQHLKIVTNGHQYTKTTEDKKFIFWINAHTPIEKQFNQDWNTPIHLERNGPHIKVPLIFWFLYWFSTFVFVTNCGLNDYV